jgi:hypothetical protein
MLTEAERRSGKQRTLMVVCEKFEHCSVISVRNAHEQSAARARLPEDEPVGGAEQGRGSRDLTLARRIPRERCAQVNGIPRKVGISGPLRS